MATEKPGVFSGFRRLQTHLLHQIDRLRSSALEHEGHRGSQDKSLLDWLSLPRRLPRQRHRRIVGVADLHRRSAQRGYQDHLGVPGIDDLMNDVGRDYQR